MIDWWFCRFINSDSPIVFRFFCSRQLRCSNHSCSCDPQITTGLVTEYGSSEVASKRSQKQNLWTEFYLEQHISFDLTVIQEHFLDDKVGTCVLRSLPNLAWKKLHRCVGLGGPIAKRYGGPQSISPIYRGIVHKFLVWQEWIHWDLVPVNVPAKSVVSSTSLSGKLAPADSERSLFGVEARAAVLWGLETENEIKMKNMEIRTVVANRKTSVRINPIWSERLEAAH